jgi:hypothetical protein
MNNTKDRISRTSLPLPRRTFLKTMLAAGAGAFLPSATWRLTAQTDGAAAAAGRRVNLACVGIGNRGADVVEELHRTGLANVVALCDTDMGAKHTQKILKRFPDVPRFQDFRQMFDKMAGQIDAVSVATPDFSHFPVCMQSMALGKHVYVEKPMARTFQEVDLMMKAEQKYKVAAQMGNQGHSGANYFQFQAWVDAGIIKNVTQITAFMNSSRRWHGQTPFSLLRAGDKPKPDTLDWDTWLTTAAYHKYNDNYVNGQWRCWFDFGMGALGDWGAHILDTAHQFLDLGLPSEITPLLIEGHDDAIFPQASTLSFKFPARRRMPPVEITWHDGVKNVPPLPEGFGSGVVDPNIPPPTSGTIETRKLAPGKVIYGEDLTFKGGSHSSTLEIIPASKREDMKARLPEVPGGQSNHFKNFLLACMGEEQCRSSFAVAGPLSQVMVLGVMAQRLNEPLKFDRSSRRITNNDRADMLLAGPAPRKGWEQYYRL